MFIIKKNYKEGTSIIHILKRLILLLIYVYVCVCVYIPVCQTPWSRSYREL